MISIDQVNATELELDENDHKAAIASGIMLTAGRTTIVLLETFDRKVAVGFTVGPLRKHDPSFGEKKARANAYRQLMALRMLGTTKPVKVAAE